ncbi:MAG: ATP-binding protein [Clostridium sp.]|nr:ATP-binding protein [Clostridium sp.]
MNFNFTNLGPLSHADISLNNLTIICGKNNTGKTYINYAIYGFYNCLYELLAKAISKYNFITIKNNTCSINLSDVFKNLEQINTDVLNSYSNDISTLVFNSNKNSFSNFKMDYKSNLAPLDIDSFKLFYKNLINDYISKSLTTFFIKEDCSNIYILNNLRNSSFELETSILEKSLITSIYHLLFGIDFNTFIIPAERNGLNLLFKELNQNRNDLFYNINNISINTLKKQISKYPLPIKNYLNFLNEDLPKTSFGQSIESSFKDISLSLEETVVGGSYIINNDNIIQFLVNTADNKDKLIDFHLASSTARTLLGLDLYIKYKIRNGDLLVIDEPELNLHPDNQRKIARVIARLVNRGVKVLISTHSDYIIKEFNNLIMLSRPFERNNFLRKKYNYLDDEILKESSVTAYVSYGETIKSSEISIEGIIINTFDDVINSYNKSSDEIYYSYLEDMNL